MMYLWLHSIYLYVLCLSYILPHQLSPIVQVSHKGWRGWTWSKGILWKVFVIFEILIGILRYFIWPSKTYFTTCGPEILFDTSTYVYICVFFMNLVIFFTSLHADYHYVVYTRSWIINVYINSSWLELLA